MPFSQTCSFQCARATMETLTLARFLCELTLQDYTFVQEGASRLAASCLLLALKMKNLGGWVRIALPPLGAMGVMSPKERCVQEGGNRQSHAQQKGRELLSLCGSDGGREGR